MRRVLNHLRSNVVAYVALFVALGGTSYAAISLPAGSVGNRQLKNHSITPVKLDRGSIAGYVRDWAEIDPSGQLVASQPSAHLVGWSATGGIVNWGDAIPRSCIAIASTDAASPVASAGATILSGAKPGPYVGAQVLLSTPTEISVAVICPQP
ncbi:MAG: hypothetical protein ACLPV4_18620 [Solirubrobacteraceae bacterium]